MNKKILISGISLVAIFAAHSGFWLYQSGNIKFALEQTAGKLSKEIGRKNTELFYTSSDISGYPLNFTLKVSQPKFITAGGGEKIEMTSGDEPIVIVSNLLGSGYNIKIPAKIDIKQTVEDVEKSYKLEFNNASPQIEAKFAGNILFNINNTEELIPYLNNMLKSLHYSDSGYILTNAEDGKKIASIDSQSIQITKSAGKTNSVSTSYNIQAQNMDASALFNTETATSDANSKPATALWPATFNIDYSSIDSKDENGKSNSVDFILRDFDVKAASFAINLKGNVKANGNDIFPFGDLSLKINSYENMVDYFGGVVSDAMDKTKLPLFHIKNEKSIDFKKVLFDISSEKSNDNKDILLTLSREQNKSLFIGQKGLMEVIDLLKASASPSIGATEESLKEGASIKPTTGSSHAPAPALDLSPSAGFPAMENTAPALIPNKPAQ